MTTSTLSFAPDRVRRSLLYRIVATTIVATLAIFGAVFGATPARAATPAIYGVITGADTNTPLNNVTVEIRNAATWVAVSTTTNASGEYSFDTVPGDGEYLVSIHTGTNSEYVILAYYPNTPLYTLAERFNLTDTSNVELNIGIPRGGSLTGDVTFSGSPHTVRVSLFMYNPISLEWQIAWTTTTNGANSFTFNRVPAGEYRVRFLDDGTYPVYEEQFYKGVYDVNDAQTITVTPGGSLENIDAHLTVEVDRYGGSDRFATSALIAAQYPSASVVFVANGLNYPDALSAAPAAAKMGAPLLLTRPDSLPAVVKAQIQRLNPDIIYVVGGTGVVSDAVFNELHALAGNKAQRLAGSNRYATSKDVFETIWDGDTAEHAFLADGRNFPDALASASAAGFVLGPVVLVNGASTTLPAGYGAMFGTFGTTNLYLPGGTAVLSAGIETAASGLPGMTVTRFAGYNRYDTSLKVNVSIFPEAPTAYLAVGTGYADALSGAALAGSEGAPLYLVPGNCVPQGVLTDIDDLGVKRIVLLGGTGVLSSAVQALTPCNF